MARNKKQPTTQPTDTDAYTHAKAQWDQRIGDARAQLRNWRLATLLSLIIVIILLIAIVIVANQQKQYVYIAQVKPGETITNMHPITEQYTATNAQQAYFIAEFIHNISTLSLDPVLLRHQWLNAYRMAEGRAVDKLTAFARDTQPFQHIGEQTKTIKIQNYHLISEHSFEFTWVQTTYDQHGKVIDNTLFDGLFTLRQGKPPTNSHELLENPTGLKISYFNIKQEG